MQPKSVKGGKELTEDRPGLHYAALEVSAQELEKQRLNPLQLSDGDAQQYWRRWDIWRKVLIWGLIGIVAVSVGVVVGTTISARVHRPEQLNNLTEPPAPHTPQHPALADALKAAARLQKPGYHITPPGGWANDPNAMFQYKGLIHVFFQHNPFRPVWASPYWAHVVTKDLVHYMRLPEAMEPDSPWDEDGVFSGSATVLGPQEGGTPVILYTGVSKFATYGFYYQVQAIAVPGNLSDPYLMNWTKPADVNPLQMPLPVGGSPAQFRDPATAWRAPLDPRNGSTWFFTGGNSTAAVTKARTSSTDMVWYTVVGAQVDCVGSATMYSSSDLRHWTPAGTLFSQLAYNYTAANACYHDESHAPPPGTKDFGGDCDQFGYCRMFECPEAFTVADGIVAFKYSDQLWGRQPFSADFYVLTTVDATFNTTNSFDSGKNLLKPMQGSDYFPAQLLDYGTVYASKSFLLEDGRRIWLGWVYEDVIGCTESCAQGTPFTEAMGWQGMQTLPREIIYNPKTRRLQFRPIPELKKLRLKPPLYRSSHALMADNPASSSDAQEKDQNSRGPTGSAFAMWNMVPARKLKEGTTLSVLNPHEQRADYPYPLKAPLLDAKQLRRRLEVEVEFTLKIEKRSVPSSDDGKEGADIGPTEEELARSKRPWPKTLPFEVGILLITGEKEITRILLNGTAKLSTSGLKRAAALAAKASAAAGPTKPAFIYPPPTSADYSLRTLDLSIDRARSGGMTNTSISPGGPVDLPAEGLPLSQPLPLHLFVDHSVLEAFALGGSGRVTSHVYSLSTHLAWGVQLFAELPKGAGLSMVAAVEVYELDSCWVGDIL